MAVIVGVCTAMGISASVAHAGDFSDSHAAGPASASPIPTANPQAANGTETDSSPSSDASGKTGSNDADAQVDAYRTGYAQAVVDQRFAFDGARVVVRGSVAVVTLREPAQRDVYRLRQTLLNLPGIERVGIVIEAPASPPRAARASSPNESGAKPGPGIQPESGAAAGAGAKLKSNGNPESTVSAEAGSGPGPEAESSARIEPAAPWLDFQRALQQQQYPQGLPPGHLFDVLIADPRWPNLYAGYVGYINQDLEQVGGVGFGAAVPLVRDEFPWGGLWELGIHAGVHAIFDLASDSFDLQNADYYVAGALGYRHGDFSALFRVYHESSHLGDEFILNNPNVQRIDLSYEMIHLLASYDVTPWLRIYGGAGYLINRYPASFDRAQLQYGAEARSPITLFDGVLRPIAAVDVQHWEEFDFSPDLSVRAGVELFDEAVLPHRLQLLLEYYLGRSPHGQFYPDAIQSLGLSLRFHY